MQSTITFDANTEHVNNEVQEKQFHSVRASVDSVGNYCLLECWSREALFELGRTLMHEALYGNGELELFPLVVEGKELVVNGVRLTEPSARLFVHYPKVRV
jgi:hypothetical protein